MKTAEHHWEARVFRFGVTEFPFQIHFVSPYAWLVILASTRTRSRISIHRGIGIVLSERHHRGEGSPRM